MPQDIFRDTWVRYLGYSNEVGEAFRPVVPGRLVAYSYGIAFGYVFADTADKTLKMIQADGRPRNVAIAAGDAILWQTFASVIIPGITINRVSKFTQRNLYSVRVLPPMVVKVFTVGIALACIPLIVSPIDHAVTFAMNLTYRKHFPLTTKGSDGVSKFAQRKLYSVRMLPPMVVKWYSVGIGLACIPLIVSPIDHAVTFAMNLTYRKYLPLTTNGSDG